MAKTKSKKWVQKALKPRMTPKGPRGKGTLTKAAKRAGKSVAQYCKKPPTKLAKQRCSLRKTLMGMKK